MTLKSAPKFAPEIDSQIRHSYDRIYARKIRAFKYLYEFTFSACGACVDSGCACKDRICQHVEERARVRGVELEKVGKPLRFIGPNGCTVAPHLRETCTIYLCGPAQTKPGFDPLRYAKVRRICDRIEWKLLEMEDRWGAGLFSGSR